MKDNFSTASDNYAKYRPQYSKAFFEYINSIVVNKDCAWDCGTGNGQIASVLAETFTKVYATDISQSQIDNAVKKSNIEYVMQKAEATFFENEQFDLIIVAQAIHWFDFPAFYKEVNRTLKKQGVFCVVGYGRIEITKEIDELIHDFYTNVIGPYWDKERKYIDEAYRTIPFPFQEIATPSFQIEYHWDLAHLMGYLNTWSAVKHFIKQNGYNPVQALYESLVSIWNPAEEKLISFPLFIRMGKLS